MSAFKFRLEKVLDVREIMEEQAKQEWAFQKRLLYEERLKLKSLEEQKIKVRNFGYQQTDVELFQAMYSYLDVLNKRITKQTSVVYKQERRTKEAKEMWFVSRQEKKKVATLREKQYEQFTKDELHKEQKILDDMRSYVQG